jgi:hypothetical protein
MATRSVETPSFPEPYGCLYQQLIPRWIAAVGQRRIGRPGYSLRRPSSRGHKCRSASAPVRVRRRWHRPIPRPGKAAGVGFLREGGIPRQVEQRRGKRVRSWTRRPGRQSVFLMPRIETAFSKSLQIIAMKFQEICNDCSRLGPSARAGEECHCLHEIHRPHRPVPDVVEGLKHNRGPQPTIS